MSQTTKRNLLVFASLLMMVFAISYAWAQIRGARPDASMDNGLHSAMPSMPPESASAMRKIRNHFQQQGQPMPTPPADMKDVDPERAREFLAQVLTPEEQKAMQEGMRNMMEQRKKVHAALGPQEARQFEGKMRTRIRQFMQQQNNTPPPPPGENNE